MDELTASTFTVTLLNPQGGQEKAVPNTLTVKHWLNEPGGAVLTNPIGIAQADKTFAPMLAKGARLPAVSRDTFHTTVALLRSDADAVIRIPIMEGERERADRNLLVGVIEIRPKDVSIDLPKGSDVEVTIEIDESRLLTVVADVPLVEEQFETETICRRSSPRTPGSCGASWRTWSGCASRPTGPGRVRPAPVSPGWRRNDS